MLRSCVALCLAAATAATACGGGDPVDVAGDYSISVTNRDNGCMFDNWTEGETAQNIAVTITQDEELATATVNGPTGAFLDVILGGRTFTGDVSGASLLLTLFGTTTAMEGNCTYTVNAILDGHLDGDVLTGELRYEAATNDNPDCAPLEGCASIQDFNGTRPPS